MKYINPHDLTPIMGQEESRAHATDYAATMRRAMSDRSYLLPESSLRLPFDNELFEKSRLLAEKLSTPNLSYVVVVGIGGSYLGTKAVYEAMCGTIDGYGPSLPKMIFADTCSPEFLGDLTGIIVEEVASKDEIIIAVISKSGGTTETMVNASFLIDALEKKLGTINDRMVYITDEGSPLWHAGEKEGVQLLPIPKTVGGRFSVFSPVGVFPLLAVGIEADKLIQGAGEVVTECVERGAESDAFRVARDIVSQSRDGAVIFDLLLFHPELESFGKWYRQLFAESLGKDVTRDGVPTKHHIVPTASIGTTDLHSVEQLYLSDPALFARTIVRVNSSHWGHDLFSNERALLSLVPGVSGRAPCQIMEIIYRGVKEVYQKRGIRFSEIELPEISLQGIGALMQFEMCVVMYLAQLLDINAFDQPYVEEYKQAVRKILGNTNE